MKQRHAFPLPLSIFVSGLFLLISGTDRASAEASPAAIAAFNSYTATVEARLARQHQSSASFVFLPSADLRRGDPVVEPLTTPSVPGGLLHHWRGSAFVPGASAAEFECLLKDFGAYPRVYAPQVLRASVHNQQGDHLTASMRVRQKHGIAVVLDTTYDVSFGRLDAQHGYSLSRSTRVAEIEAAGTVSEHALTPAQEHGFLWRLNTYWSYEERDGGLYIQIESITLTRAIPHGLAWVVQPFVESIPRESLEFTLRATANALHK
jgi:hypothetical protein